MTFGPTRLKILGGVGTLVVCGASGVVVALGAKPESAPLKPPADPSKALGQPSQPASGSGALEVPLSTCGGQAGAKRAPTPGVPPGTDPAVAGALQRIAAAKTAQQRQAILAGLTADQRQQVTALLAQAARNGEQKRGVGGGACAEGPQSQQSGGGGGTRIAPDQVQGGPVQTPVVNTYVS